MKIRTTQLLAAGAVLALTAGTASAANVALDTNGGVASHINSMDSAYAVGTPGVVNDGNIADVNGNINHTDAADAGSGAGFDLTIPDIVRIDFDMSYDLMNIVVYNRGLAHGGDAATTSPRLNGATIQAWDVTDTQVGASGVVSGAALNSIHTFDNGGLGYANVSYITLSSNTYIHVREIEANEVPEPGSLALLGLGGLMIARRRRRA